MGNGDGAALVRRQHLLILYSAVADLASGVVAWSRYDGSSNEPVLPGDEQEPPYTSVLAAMRDGWRVLQLPQLHPVDRDDPYAAAHLRYEYVLERIEEISHG